MTSISFIGCKRDLTPISDNLRQIDATLQSDPESAYSMLEKLNIDTIREERSANFYRLLLVEAQDKTFRDDTIYKDICSTAEYFDSIGDKRNAMRSLFYCGRIFQNRHEYGRAIINLLKAEEKADSAEHLYRGKIYNAISESYKEVYDSPQELEYAHKALAEYEKLDSLPFVNDAKLWLGLSLCRNNMAEKGIPMMTKIYTDARANGDELTQADALQYLSLGYLWNNDYTKAKDCLSLLYSTHSNFAPQDYADLYLTCLIATNSNNDSIETAASILKQFLPDDQIPHQYYQYKKDYCGAYKSIREDFKTEDSLFLIKIRNDVALAVNLHMADKTYKSNIISERLRDMVYWIVFCSLLCFIIIGVTIYLYYLKKKSNVHELLYSLEVLQREKNSFIENQNELTNINEQLMKDNQSLINFNKELSLKNNTLQDNNESLIEEKEVLKVTQQHLIGENNQLKKEYSDYKSCSKTDNKTVLLQSFFKELDSLHSEYYKAVTSEKSKNIVLNHIAIQLKRIREDYDLLTQMEGYINSIYDNLLSEMYINLKLNLEQRRIVALQCLDFSKESICQIMGITLPNYYTRMNRLIKRIEGSKSLRKHELLDFMRKKHANKACI